jgi:hypothetical protein
MTSINGQDGGFRKEVGYPKLRPALLIASSLAGRVVQDAIGGWIQTSETGRLNALRTEGVVGDDVENILRF